MKSTCSTSFGILQPDMPGLGRADRQPGDLARPGPDRPISSATVTSPRRMRLVADHDPHDVAIPLAQHLAQALQLGLVGVAVGADPGAERDIQVIGGGQAGDRGQGAPRPCRCGSRGRVPSAGPDRHRCPRRTESASELGSSPARMGEKEKPWMRVGQVGSSVGAIQQPPGRDRQECDQDGDDEIDGTVHWGVLPAVESGYKTALAGVERVGPCLPARPRGVMMARGGVRCTASGCCQMRRSGIGERAGFERRFLATSDWAFTRDKPRSCLGVQPLSCQTRRGQRSGSLDAAAHSNTTVVAIASAMLERLKDGRLATGCKSSAGEP